MWPLLVDMSKEESIQYLRHLELEAYSHLVSALRAQGPLNSDKKRLLKDTGVALNITQERHKAEIRRALSDEKLNTVAYHMTGQTDACDDWAQEGRRCVPLLPRLAPQTAYSAIADEAAENAHLANRRLPSPSNTERKRQATTTPQLSGVGGTPQDTATASMARTLSFRVPEQPPPSKTELECSRKRKLSTGTAGGDNNHSCLAHHLLGGPSKQSRIQQLYRQRTKAKTKEQYQLKYKPEPIEQHHQQQQQQQQQHLINKLVSSASTSSTGYVGTPTKINVLQNISIQPPGSATSVDDAAEPLSGDLHTTKAPCVDQNENQAPRTRLLANVKQGTVSLKQIASNPVAGSSSTSDLHQKSIKMCTAKKPITKATGTGGQKLIVVSNAQTIPTSSILQRTLSIPFVKNISVKNFDKFKIVTSGAAAMAVAGTSTTTAATNNANSVKHKVVTVRTNSNAKKMIPLSQLQVLNSKGSIKVLPLGGKIVGKTVTATASASSPLYIMNTVANMQSFAKTSTVAKESASTTTNFEVSTSNTITTTENGKSSVLEDILKASGVISTTEEQQQQQPEDYDSKIEEFHIEQRQVEATIVNGTDEVQNYMEVGVKSEEIVQEMETEAVHTFDLLGEEVVDYLTEDSDSHIKSEFDISAVSFKEVN